MKTRVHPGMPPMGVADVVLGHEEDSMERYRLWLLTHTAPGGAGFWAAAVLRECAVGPTDEFAPLAAGDLLG